MARDDDAQPFAQGNDAANSADRAVAALFRRGPGASHGPVDGSLQEMFNLWDEMDGLKRSSGYAALLGRPTLRERLVALRHGMSLPSWRMAWPVVPVGALAALAVYVLMPRPEHYETTDQARTVTLPDSSTVDLARASRVAFEETGGQRIARLTGEARFSVAHDKARPFLVHVGDAQVRVVGTRFTLAQHGACTQLSVLSGTVDISAPNMATRRLHAGEEAVTVANGQPYRTCLGTAAGGAPMRWSYIDVPLSTVIADAGRFYARRIVIRAPEIAGEHVTMAFRGEEIEKIIDLIPELTDARIDHGADGTIYIDKR